MKVEACYADFGKTLKARREEMGMSQSELGRLLSLERVSIANIEAGRQRFLFHHALYLAGLFGLDLNRFRPKLRIEWPTPTEER